MRFGTRSATALALILGTAFATAQAAGVGLHPAAKLSIGQLHAVPSFNPQPEPPGRWSPILRAPGALTGLPGALGGSTRMMFNPQPDPPGRRPKVNARFNPQPEPPGD